MIIGQRKQLVLIAGARPNFMKISPLIDAIRLKGISYALVHTGQHYDAKMSDDFFTQLNIPLPDANLESGGGSPAEQTASIMVRFERYLIENPCDMVVVVGDVTSTLACSIVAKKLNVKVAHVEGGIRSGDITMPEEINRLVTDAIADYFFTTTETAGENLVREGREADKIFFVGNTMIDTLNRNLSRLRKPIFWDQLDLRVGHYFVLTLHRPSNVDSKEQLSAILESISLGVRELPVIFPVHPRTQKNIALFQLKNKSIHMVEPMGYLEFNYLVKNSKGVITDSGGVTEETTVMGIPCITLRNTTERPETCTLGTNELIGTDTSKIAPALHKIIANQWKKGSIPALWDGKAAERTAEILRRLLQDGI